MPDGGSEAGNWIQLRLIGQRSNRYGIGARVVVGESSVREGHGVVAQRAAMWVR